MKIWNHCFSVGILAILILGCSGGSSLNGTWENKELGITVLFSGKNLTIDGRQGTFSISGDNIELSIDGETQTTSFSRIDNNTITIEGTQFTRLNKKSESTTNKGKSSGDKSFNNTDELKAYLDKQPVNGIDNPIKISIVINNPMLKNVGDVIKASGKYVSLNITGNALTTIDGAFRNCTSLTSITIPNSVTEIERRAFYGCISLTSVTFQGTTNNFWYDVFHGDLRNKYFAEGPGTYITTTPPPAPKDMDKWNPVWMKQ